MKVVKNKVAPPFRIAEFDMMHADGISKEGDLIDLGLAAKLIEKSGTWIRYNDSHLGQGREKARLYLKENPDGRRRNSAENCDKPRTSRGD